MVDEINLKKERNETPKNGILTASEHNDLGSWELWKDVAKNQLKIQSERWKFQFNKRFSVLVQGENGCPLSIISVQLLSQKKVIWESVTDNNGICQLWLMDSTLGDLSMKVIGSGTTLENQKLIPFEEGMNFVTLNQKPVKKEEIDIVFAVDATGSMQDEIDFLKADLNEIILDVKKNNPNCDLNLGSVYYQCFGSPNQYVTSSIDLTPKTDKVLKFISSKNATGGGDEVVQIALDSAINKLKWRPTAKAKLLFIVLDEPPSWSIETAKKMMDVYQDAARKGIKIIPCISSNFDEISNISLEYLMRNAALATNGTLVFLTDDSGVGGRHKIPFNVTVKVELFKDLLTRLIDQSLEQSPCELSTKNVTKESLTEDNKEEVVNEILSKILSSDSVYNTILPFTDFTSIDSLSKYSPVKELDTSKLIQAYKKEVETITIYPNPSFGNFTLTSSSPIEFIEILDATGKILVRQKGTTELMNEINITSFPTGNYIIRVKIKEAVLQRKIQVVH